MIKVVLIGSGNVARHLFHVFSENRAIEIVQVVSRNQKVLKNFGTQVKSTTDFSRIEDSDIYIVAVSDNAIQTVSKALTAKNGLIAHTSGSASIDVLSDHERIGVFYPLQTFSKDRKVDFKKVPFCLEANHKADLRKLKKLASHISEKVFEVPSEQRKKLHLAAVFVNNFANHLYHIGNRICEENNIPFEILNPLMGETIKKLEKLSPYEAQTGPARRNDTQTMNLHLEQLKNDKYKEIYTVLSQSIQKTYGKKL